MIHYVGGVPVHVRASNIRTPLSFQAGIAIQVDPRLALGFVVGHKRKAEAVDGRATFEGSQYDESAQACEDCHMLTLRSRTYFGFLPQNPFTGAVYTVRITIGGHADTIRGTIVYKDQP